MSGRFATQRLLAERPKLVLSDSLADEINSLVDALLMQSGGPDGVVLARKVGPQLVGAEGQPLQMEMRLANGFVDPVYDAAMYRSQGIGAVRGELGTLDALARMDPQKVREISFGWRPAGSAVGQGKLNYDNSVDTRGVDFKSKLQAVKESLLEQSGMQAGDLVTAMPYGLADGDQRRALTYLRQGYGLPDASSGAMFGQLQGDGTLQPVQLYTPEASMMKRLGFTQA